MTPRVETSGAISINPDLMEVFGTLGTATISLSSAPSDGKVHEYHFTFISGSSASVITWPVGLSWNGGSAPTIKANKKYEVSIIGSLALIAEY